MILISSVGDMRIFSSLRSAEMNKKNKENQYGYGYIDSEADLGAQHYSDDNNLKHCQSAAQIYEQLVLQSSCHDRKCNPASRCRKD
jgi:hypothetical protein